MNVMAYMEYLSTTIERKGDASTFEILTAMLLENHVFQHVTPFSYLSVKKAVQECNEQSLE
jgi:hypothetical protein